MSKNMLFLTFLFVFIACSMFITLTVHSAGLNHFAPTAPSGDRAVTANAANGLKTAEPRL